MSEDQNELYNDVARDKITKRYASERMSDAEYEWAC